MQGEVAQSFPWLQVIVSVVSALVGAISGGIVGGTMARRAALAAVEKTSQNLESEEMRRQKLDCIATLSGLRFLVERSVVLRPEEHRAKLAFELNRMLVLWSDDPKALRAIRDFYADSKSVPRLVTLLRTLGKTTLFPMDNLSDSDLKAIFKVD